MHDLININQEICSSTQTKNQTWTSPQYYNFQFELNKYQSDLKLKNDKMTVKKIITLIYKVGLWKDLWPKS